MESFPDRSSINVPALFARAQAGDQNAWQELFDASYAKVRRVIRRRLDSNLQSVFDSSDFAHDVWLSLASKPEKFDFENLDALIAFLRQSAERKLIDEQRRMHAQKRDVNRERRIDAHPAGEAGGMELASSDHTASKYVLEGETREQLKRAAESEEGRRVLELKAEGHTNEEIAHETGLHLRKVQRLLSQLQRWWLGRNT